MCTNGGSAGGAFACSANYVARLDIDVVACPTGVCTDAVCCDKTCQNGGTGGAVYECATGYKSLLSSVACRGGSCTDALCCES